MDEDNISDVDSILTEVLSDYESEPTAKVNDSREENAIQLLQFAADELDKSPTIQEFNDLNLEVSGDSIKHIFGTWNEAKEAAGLETYQRGTTREINEEYFKLMDSGKKWYWFGVISATSSLRDHEKGDNYGLRLSRAKNKSYLVTTFVNEIESDYPIRWVDSNKSDKKQVKLTISNPTFIKHLLGAGYPESEDEEVEFSVVDDKYRSLFLRGFLESSGYFSTGGWRVRVSDLQRGETLQEWFKQYGAKRPTVSENSSGAAFVSVANPFDIKAVFESLWPDILETDPSWKPYPKKIIQHLKSEHPYPENLSYLNK